MSPASTALVQPWTSPPCLVLDPNNHTKTRLTLPSSSFSLCFSYSINTRDQDGGLVTTRTRSRRTEFLCTNCSLHHQGAPSFGSENQQQPQPETTEQRKQGWWSKWRANSAEMSSKLAKLGLAAVLAYGLFDGVTYTSFFVLAFFGYEKSTGKNPAANLQALLGIVILMWTGNNITRPFRVAGAAALAPLIDKGLKKIQKRFGFPNLVYAFALVASIVAGTCLTIVGLLILSRWGK
ncbi:hypothetical protein Tsubulata_016059 [Turnera subulata]|uniref:Uncharacterized protein n=1 Tax=Turnera subulata TaxID=218843 RepID=A0A9Q0J9B5_9ROSI|nr:hypothetical protein Tsubulata_016059 [Turnera subulata]